MSQSAVFGRKLTAWSGRGDCGAGRAVASLSGRSHAPSSANETVGKSIGTSLMWCR
jgi:hypothetical protein